MKKVVLAAAAASVMTPVFAEPMIGNNLTFALGIPSNGDFEYDSAASFDIEYDIFLNDSFYFTGSWGAFAYQLTDGFNTGSVGQGHLLFGLGFEKIIQPEVAVFVEGSFGSLAVIAEVNGFEMFRQEGFLTEIGIGARRNAENFYNEIMLSTRNESFEGFEPERNFALEADVGLNVSSNFTLGLTSKFDLDFENTLVGVKAGFKF